MGAVHAGASATHVGDEIGASGENDTSAAAAAASAELDLEEDQHSLAFHNTVREYVLVFVLVLLLLAVSALLIGRLVRRSSSHYAPSSPHHSQPPSPTVAGCSDDVNWSAHQLTDDEWTVIETSATSASLSPAAAAERTVRRTVLLVCALSLALSLATLLLLPATVAAQRLQRLWSQSPYWHWLSAGLVHALWRHVTQLANACLFVLLPFAHLLAESEGFSGHGQGLAARVCETCTVLLLLVCMVLGSGYLLSPASSASTSASCCSASAQLTALYACVSTCGVLLLLLCTPLGFACLFDAAGRLLCRPAGDRHRLRQLLTAAQLQLLALQCHDSRQLQPLSEKAVGSSRCAELAAARGEVCRLRRQLDVSWLRRYVGYPLLMCTLLTLTVAATLLVVRNALELVVGLKALPFSTQQATMALSAQLPSGAVGVAGALLEVLVVTHLLVASLVGAYSLPVLKRLAPRSGATGLSALIANCALLLVIGSALPQLVCTLGVAPLQLPTHYYYHHQHQQQQPVNVLQQQQQDNHQHQHHHRLQQQQQQDHQQQQQQQLSWMDRLPVVLLYNVVFAVASVVAMCTRVTATVRHALLVHAATAFAAARATLAALTGVDIGAGGRDGGIAGGGGDVDDIGGGVGGGRVGGVRDSSGALLVSVAHSGHQQRHQGQRLNATTAAATATAATNCIL